jgi:MSHA biogenesis protein MshO
MSRPRGFTLLELVVSIAISSIVIVFAAMFISAPLGAYEQSNRRAVLAEDAAGAWPTMENDLRNALPNSLRARRQGNNVVIEMLEIADWARYLATPAATTDTAGVIRNFTHGIDTATNYLSVNNTGIAPRDAYLPASASMTPAGSTIHILAQGTGDRIITTPAPAATLTGSPQQLIYVVRGPVTYLCNENTGTLTRYSGYTIAGIHAQRDTANELTNAGATSQLVAQGLATCNFDVLGPLPNVIQQVSIRFTTTRANDTVSTLHVFEQVLRP